MLNIPIRVNLGSDRTVAPYQIRAGGYEVYVVNASSESALVQVNMTGRDITELGPFNLQNGDHVRITNLFDLVNVYHTQQAGEWVDIMIVAYDSPPTSFEYVRVTRSVIDSIAEPVKAIPYEGTATAHSVVSVDTTAGGTKVLDADASRKSALVYIPRSFTGTLYTGAATGVDNTGPILEGGTFYEHKTPDALWMLSSSGSVSVSVREAK